MPYCPGGEAVNATVCKTVMRGFESHPGLKGWSCVVFANIVNSHRLIYAPLAQLVEQLPLKETVQGSSP